LKTEVTLNGAERKLEDINARLKHGEGWIGYRYHKTSDGQQAPSSFLYYSFYHGRKQKFVRTKTNDPERAYRELLAARKQVEDGNRLPSEVSKLRYEDLKSILMDHYRERAPDSLYTRRTEDGGREQTFLGADKLDKFFKRCPITEITALKLQEFIKWRRRKGDSGPTIRRQLGKLRTAFNCAKALDLVTDNHIPTFVLPADSKPRKGFLDLDGFETLRDAMPENLQPATVFLYYTGCRTGAAKKITWEMVSKDCNEIELPGEIVKNDDPLTLPLVGPLKEIAVTLRTLRKSFPQPTDRVFDFTNFRWEWDRVCAKLGFGVFDKESKTYSGLIPHDFRRSAARNLIKAGLDRRAAMKITGHKTEHIFERYNIKTTTDIQEALIKAGTFKKSATVVPIAETSATL
jgi:integrase